MLASLKLLLPALIPSWRFFDSVGPSPRLEFLAPDAQGWREFRPLPQRMSARAALWRLLWNPDGNERLYLIRCAERLIEERAPHLPGEIEARLAGVDWTQWRIALVRREGAGLTREIAYLSPARRRS